MNGMDRVVRDSGINRNCLKECVKVYGEELIVSIANIAFVFLNSTTINNCKHFCSDIQIIYLANCALIAAFANSIGMISGNKRYLIRTITQLGMAVIACSQIPFIVQDNLSSSKNLILVHQGLSSTIFFMGAISNWIALLEQKRQ